MIQLVKGLSDLRSEVFDSLFEWVNLGNQELGLDFDGLNCSWVFSWGDGSIGLEIIENSSVEG